MSLKLELPNRDNLTEQEYIEQRLVPLAANMEQLCSKMFSTIKEDEYSDMTCTDAKRQYTPVDTLVLVKPKSFKLAVPYEWPLVNNDKNLRALFMAVLYNKEEGSSVFRLVRNGTDSEMENSQIQVTSTEPTVYQRYIKVGHGMNEVKFGEYEYHVQAKLLGMKRCVPICRSFSISLTYV